MMVLTAKAQLGIFRVVVWALLSSIAWLASDLVRLYLLGLLMVGDVSLAPAFSAAESGARIDVDIHAIATRNLFNVKAESPAVPSDLGAALGKTADADKQLPLRAGSDLLLRGTWIGEQGAFAIIEDRQAKRETLFRSGDHLPSGEEVLEILPIGVKLKTESGLELLVFPEEWRDGSFMASRSGRRGRVRGGEIQKVSPGRYQVSQRYLEHQLNNMTEVMKQARAIARPDGFLLRRIKKGGLVDRVGLRNGDVLRSINGMQLRSFEQAARAFKLLRNENNLQLEVVRGGNVTVLSYEIR